MICSCIYLSTHRKLLSIHISVYTRKLLKKQNNSLSTQSNPIVMQHTVSVMNYQIKFVSQTAPSFIGFPFALGELKIWRQSSYKFIKSIFSSLANIDQRKTWWSGIIIPSLWNNLLSAFKNSTALNALKQIFQTFYSVNLKEKQIVLKITIY